MKSELTLEQLLKQLNFDKAFLLSVIIKYNGNTVVNEDNCYTMFEYAEAVSKFLSKYKNRIVYSIKINVVSGHHIEIDIKGAKK